MDGRLSSNSLKTSLVDGIISTGVDVIDIGRLPTPLLYFSLHQLDTPNGIMITGSHNPKDYNGIKIVLNWKTLFDKYILELRDIMLEKKYYNPTSSGSYTQNENIVHNYIENIKKNILINNNINISVDCGNGITGVIVEKLFNALSIKANIINQEVDGNFPNHPPDPSNEKNLKQLQNHVLDNGSDVGFAYDGDGDRVTVIRNDGSILWPDQQLMIFTKNVLESNPGGKIIFDVKCTKHLKDTIEKYGGKAILSRTGHSYIKNLMVSEQAVLGGEMSGHIFFADKWKGFDDGIYASLRLLEILGSSKVSSNLLFELPESYTTPEINIPFDANNHFTFMNLFVKLAKFDGAEIIVIDGLKIIYEDCWGLIRCSNTTSSLVLRFEADSKGSLEKIQSIMKSAMLKVDGKLEIPF
jgi:phosphomannomutase/phosphoglucomutase